MDQERDHAPRAELPSRPMRTPGVCPGCGADWRIGPNSRGLTGVVHCTCRTATGGVHPRLECQDCDVRVVPECVDPSRSTNGWGYRKPLEG
jgi:hypothetical protein